MCGWGTLARCEAERIHSSAAAFAKGDTGLLHGGGGKLGGMLVSIKDEYGLKDGYVGVPGGVTLRWLTVCSIVDVKLHHRSSLRRAVRYLLHLA